MLYIMFLIYTFIIKFIFNKLKIRVKNSKQYEPIVMDKKLIWYGKIPTRMYVYV